MMTILITINPYLWFLWPQLNAWDFGSWLIIIIVPILPLPRGKVRYKHNHAHRYLAYRARWGRNIDFLKSYHIGKYLRTHCLLGTKFKSLTSSIQYHVLYECVLTIPTGNHGTKLVQSFLIFRKYKFDKPRNYLCYHNNQYRFWNVHLFDTS